jgi:Prophage protein (DUF1660)
LLLEAIASTHSCVHLASNTSSTQLVFAAPPTRLMLNNGLFNAFWSRIRRGDAMRILCRILGHQVSRSRLQLDPFSFTEYSHCRRCEKLLVRAKDHTWKEVIGKTGDSVTAQSDIKKRVFVE